MRHTVALVLLLTLAGFAGTARADLVAVDVFSAGDGLITRDTDTNLDWLDVPTTMESRRGRVSASAGSRSAR